MQIKRLLWWRLWPHKQEGRILTARGQQTPCSWPWVQAQAGQEGTQPGPASAPGLPRLLLRGLSIPGPGEEESGVDGRTSLLKQQGLQSHADAPLPVLPPGFSGLDLPGPLPHLFQEDFRVFQAIPRLALTWLWLLPTVTR